jgi:hypothetical protein
MKTLICIVICAGMVAQVLGQSGPGQTTVDTAVQHLVSGRQVLLTNYAYFKGHKEVMYGASAFLVNYRNKVYAVTAKHMLGPDMGIKPEIKPRDLNRYLIEWVMFPRIPVHPKTDTIKVRSGGLNYDSLDKDILLLEVTGPKGIYPLTPAFTIPTRGDRLYIIGCPYSQRNCKQNIYPVTFERYEAETSMLDCIITMNFELAGFSGAPIVNANGKVVGVFTSGWEEGKTKFIGGTFIKELEKVK